MSSPEVWVFFYGSYMSPEVLRGVERILAPAEKFGFPAWYVERIRSFKPKS